jgi:hypothetical protein
MSCQHYKNALIEAAAAGGEPQSELRAHLNACASCRAAFAQEQSLFAAIDSGLHATANAEVPPSLLPRVRGALDEAAAPSRSWAQSGLVLASAAGMVALFFVVHALWRTGSVQNPPQTAANAALPGTVGPLPQLQNPGSQPPVSRNPVPEIRRTISKSSSPQGRLASRDTIPEVLVPRDQEILLVQYAEQWSARKRAPLLAVNAGAPDIEALQVAPIQIDQLDVKLLAEDESQ